MALTPYQTVYDAFLSKIEEDSWAWTDDMAAVQADWKTILDSAIAHIKFPRVNLYEQDSEGFLNELGAQEVQLIANYMKVEWLSRNVNSWEKVRDQYGESDFSQANYVDKLTNLLESSIKTADKLQHNYYRAPNGRPYRYSGLAGDN